MSQKTVSRSLALAISALGLAVLFTAGCGGGDDKNDTPSAVVKFCNPLSLASGPLDLTIEIGSAAPITLTASSGTCTPAAKQACLRMPAGVNVPVVLKMASERWSSVVLPEIKVGEEWLVVADLTDANQPILDGGPIPAEAMFKCADLAFDDIFETTPPAGGGMTPTPRI